MSSLFRRPKTPTGWRSSSRERARSPDLPPPTRPPKPGLHVSHDEEAPRCRHSKEATHENRPQPATVSHRPDRAPSPDRPATMRERGERRRPAIPVAYRTESAPSANGELATIGQCGERGRAPTPSGHRASAHCADSPAGGRPRTPAGHRHPITPSTQEPESVRGRPVGRASPERTPKRKISTILLKRRPSELKDKDVPGMLDKVVNYGAELKERARSRVRRNSTASHRPPAETQVVPLPHTLEDALSCIADLRQTGSEYLRNLALAEERLSQVEDDRHALREEVDRLRTAEDDAAVLRRQVDSLRKTALQAQKDAAAANENARHADAARERDAAYNAERIQRLEHDLDDLRDRWRWLKEHTGFREAYSGFAKQPLSDYRAWAAYWDRKAARERGETVEEEDEMGGGWEEFDVWLRFREEQEDAVRDALKEALEEERARWQCDVSEERAAWTAERSRWEEQKSAMAGTEAKLRTQLADAQYAAIQLDAVMQQKIDNLAGYLRTSEAEQKRLHSDLATARQTEAGLRSCLDTAQETETRLRSRLDTAHDTESRLRSRLEVVTGIIAELEAKVETMRPELEKEKKKHADYRRVAAGLTRDKDKLKTEVARLRQHNDRLFAQLGGESRESEDEFHDTQESIEPHAL